ncbi:MAG: MMPL family transporter, partial [Candidatus Absconditabacteria bacterium]|nr:MMPL family transporter [Candidatus Absconditabacteria bacterium]
DQVAQLSSEIQSFLLSNAVVSSTSDIIGQAIIGPSVGSYMKTSAFQALIIGILLMVVYMLIAFKEIRKFISPSILATVVVTVIILNVLVTVGAYGAWMMFNPTIQVDTVFIIAILTVIAYGINDVIIIFDRIRENMMKLTKEKTIVYGKVIEESLRQTMRRSIGTSLSTLLVLIAMLIFGTGVLQNFAFTVAIGVIVTTFSSIFLGGSLAYLLMGKYNKEKEKIS